MRNKILIPLDVDYGRAVKGLGRITDNVEDFFKRPEEYMLVLFTGGSDVGPELYGETSPLSVCGSNRHRDMYEIEIFNHAIKHDIKMTGICRGSQFINVMSGGKMMHNLNGHAGGRHFVTMSSNNKEYLVNSFHHQMSIPSEDAYVIAWSSKRLSRSYVGDGDRYVKYDGYEVEAQITPKTKCFGVQWHPEMMPRRSDGYKLYHKMVIDFLSMDLDHFVSCHTGRKMLEAGI